MHRHAPALLAVAFVLAGCGLKGDLYLPEPAEQAPAQPSVDDRDDRTPEDAPEAPAPR